MMTNSQRVDLNTEQNALQCIVVGLHNHPKLAKLTSRNLNKSLGIHKVSFCISSVIELH